ncbi:MAG: hypothetical protein ACRD8Z_23050, partial [Nitrososphaeraceae archaeon]
IQVIFIDYIFQYILSLTLNGILRDDVEGYRRFKSLFFPTSIPRLRIKQLVAAAADSPFY